MFGDSAFENSWFLVSAIKQPRNATLPREQELFNDNVSPVQKKQFFMYVQAACILHNLLLKCDIPDEWIDQDGITDIDDPDRAWLTENDDELNIAVPAGAANDLCQEQLVNYMLQLL